MKYNRQNIIHQFNHGYPIKWLFFWGHQPAKDGSISKSCFSQWWEESFYVNEMEYRSAEHWMMAEKARLFNDKEMLSKILAATSPGEAKDYGRAVRNFDPNTWDSKKYEIVVQGNLHKFSSNEALKTFLINTKNRVLVEASPRDRIWGIGMGQNNPDATNPYKWRGHNLLGFALMEVRDLLI